MLKFYSLHGEMKDHDFYLTGESYAGKYIPNMAKAIIDHNKGTGTKIPLKGMAIGDGLVDTTLQ
jgi:vitellogenic carboxypeptidase-like protein